MREKKRKKHILWLLIIGLVILLIAPVPVKTAVSVRVEETEISMKSIVGQKVSLLCSPYMDDDKWPTIEKYEIVGIGDSDGNFKQPLFDGAGVSMVYLSQNNFVGGAIKSYNWGFSNLFIFRGELSVIAETANRKYAPQYYLTLDSWDIVEPIYHWEFCIGPRNKFYQNHLFIFDYLIPYPY